MKFWTFILAAVCVFSVTVSAEDTRAIRAENKILTEGTMEANYYKDMVIDDRLLNDAASRAISEKEEYASKSFDRQLRTCIQLNLKNCGDNPSFTVDSSVADYAGLIDEISVNAGGIYFYINPENFGELDSRNSSVSISIKDNDSIISKYNGAVSPAVKMALIGVFGVLALFVMFFMVFFIAKREFNPGFKKANMYIAGAMIEILSILSVLALIFVEFTTEPKKLEADDEIHLFSVDFEKNDVSGIFMGIPLFDESFDSMYTAACKQQDSGNDSVIGGNYIMQNDLMKFPVTEGGDYYLKNNGLQFTDINESKMGLYEAVTVLASKNIVNGKTEGVFGADDNITRAEIVTILCKMLYLDTNTHSGSSFSDVSSSDWYYAYVMTGKENNLLSGFEDNTFHPTDNITRQQMAVIVGQQMKNWGYLSAEDTSSIERYQDWEEIRDYAIDGIALMDRENINIWEDYYEPDRPLTRGEAAIILYRLYLLMQ